MSHQLWNSWFPTQRIGPSQPARPAKLWLRLALFAGLAVLLGHATIEHTVSPFGLAFFAVLAEIIGTRRSVVGFAAIAGAWWQGGLPASEVMAIGLGLYLLLRVALFRHRRPDIHWLPLLTAIIGAGAFILGSGLGWSRYLVLLALANGALTAILSLIFVQTLPLLTGRNAGKGLRTEQLLSLVIFTGSIITGLAGVQWRGLSAAEVAIDTAVLLFAICGGVMVSTTAAIVLGILALLSNSVPLASVAVLAFAGLLAGVVRDAGRFWSCLVFTIAVGLLAITHRPDWTAVGWSVAAAAIAAVLCLSVPLRWRRTLSEYLPGTNEYRRSEQDRARRIRTLLSEKVHDMGHVFDELSETFADVGDTQVMSDQQLLGEMVGAAAHSVCAGCPRRGKCWEREGFSTYQAIVHTIAKLEENPSPATQATADLRDRCIRLDLMLANLRANLELTHRDAKWMAKLREQNSIVAMQLSGVATVIRSIASEIDAANEASLSGEEQVLAALEQLGLYVDHVHIVSLEAGKVEIEVAQPSQGSYENSVRVIAPLLSGIVGENISVARVYGDDEPGPCTTVFTSARLYDVDTAVASVARDGRLVSGDTHASVDLGNGRFAVAVSDGMGNGDRARRESRAALELLKKLLKTGFGEQLAIQTVNSTLLLRSRDEMFTTLDMALIDLFSARAEFLKIGSAPSFVKRHDQVRVVTGSNVPIGILRDIEVQSIQEQLVQGDLLILMSDGVYDAPQVYDKETWFCNQIQRLDKQSPQQVADMLIEAAVRVNHGQIMDDMTVMVAAIGRHQPEWAAIKLPGVAGLRTPTDRRRRGA